MVETTYNTIISEEFKSSCRQIMGLAMPIAVCKEFAEALKEIHHLQAEFDTERIKLLSTHGKRAENGDILIEGGNYVLKEGSQETYQKAYTALVTKKVKIPSIDASKLGDISLPPTVLAPLLGTLLV